MPDDYYDDGEMTATATESESDSESTAQSSLVPKSFFAGKKDLAVGDTEVVKILRIMDDEVEIECVKENYDEEEETEEVSVTTESDEMME